MSNSSWPLEFLFGILARKKFKEIKPQLIADCNDEYEELVDHIDSYTDSSPHLRLMLIAVLDTDWKMVIKEADLAQEEYKDLIKYHNHIEQVCEQYEQEQTKDKLNNPWMEREKTYHAFHISTTNNIDNFVESSKLQKQDVSQETNNQNELPVENKNLADRNEISREACQKLKHNNPNITDLSDPNRPTKVAEKFSELYDNEWTDAFESLNSNLGEKETIKCLFDILKRAYIFCKKESYDQIKAMDDMFESIIKAGTVSNPDYPETKTSTHHQCGGNSLLINYRKEIAATAIDRLQKTFIKLLQDEVSEVKGRLSSGPVGKYADRCVEVNWWMSVQDPPIYMDISNEPSFNSSLYKAYTKSGKVVDFYAWPALLLFKNGPVLMKGVAQCK